MSKKMNYSGKGVSDADLKEIMTSLTEETTDLDLSHNLISDKGVETIFQDLKENKVIEDLNLENNKITLAGCQIIQDMLEKYGKDMRNLKKLNIAFYMTNPDQSEAFKLAMDIEKKVQDGAFKKSNIDDGGYNIPTSVPKDNQSKSTPWKGHNKRKNIINTPDLVDHKKLSSENWLQLEFEGILRQPQSKNMAEKIDQKLQYDLYAIQEYNEIAWDSALQEKRSSDLIIKLQEIEQRDYDHQDDQFLEALQKSMRSSENKTRNKENKYESNEDKHSLKNENFSEQWNGVKRNLEEVRDNLRSPKVTIRNNPTTDPLGRTQIEQIELARELFNIKLTQVFTKALAIRYRLVDAHNHSRVGTVVGGAITLVSAFVPVPGATLAAQALAAAGKFVINKFITLSAQKVMEERDIKQHGQRLAGDDIHTITIDKAAKIVKALVDGLTCRYQLVLAQLNPESLEVFVNCVMKRMMNYWDKKVPNKFKKESGMGVLGQSLIDFTHSPYEYCNRKGTLTEDEQFKSCIENMIIGSSLWVGRETKKSGFLAKKSSGNGKIAKAAGFAVGDRLN